MSDNKPDSWQLDERLRKRAEAKLLNTLQINADASLQTVDQLLHELRVHQIELEMQNEELRNAQSELAESRDRYVDLYEFAPVGYLTLTLEGVITQINLTGTGLLGGSRTKFMGCRFAKYIVPEDRDCWDRHFIEFKQQGGKQAIELRLLHADGIFFHAYLDCLTIEIDNQPSLLRITLTDITLLKHAEQQLRIAATVFQSQQGITITDANGLIIAVNNTFTNITGYTAEEVIGKNPRLLQSGRHDVNFYQTLWDSIHRTGMWKGEIWNRRKNGEIYPQHLIITAVKDQCNNTTNYVGTFDDITLSKLAADEIEHLAFYDPLTDLPNRRQLMTRLHQALAASDRLGLMGALLFIDLDNFKMLNDTFGHHIGDLLLQQVAQRLVTCVREDDTVARLGGDEFVVMLENLSANSQIAATEAKIAGLKILATFAQPYALECCEHTGTSSIGIVLFNGHKNSVDDLLKWADIAMYEAKSAGRNTLRFFDSHIQAAGAVGKI